MVVVVVVVDVVVIGGSYRGVSGGSRRGAGGAAGVEDPVADALLLGRTVDGGLDAELGQRAQHAVLLLDAAVHRPDRVVGRRRRVHPLAAAAAAAAAAAQAQPRRRRPPRQPLVLRVLEIFCTRWHQPKKN